MEENNIHKLEDKMSAELLYKSIVLLVQFSLVLVVGVISFLLYDAFIEDTLKNKSGIHLSKEQIEQRLIEIDQDENKIIDGIHVSTGLVYTENFELIKGTCTSCHSAKLITQNRATREGWTEMIRWMQETQGLWELGSNEKIIVDYLAEYYAPAELGRRANLNVEEIEWYILDM